MSNITPSAGTTGGGMTKEQQEQIDHLTRMLQQALTSTEVAKIEMQLQQIYAAANGKALRQAVQSAGQNAN